MDGEMNKVGRQPKHETILDRMQNLENSVEGLEALVYSINDEKTERPELRKEKKAELITPLSRFFEIMPNMLGELKERIDSATLKIRESIF